MALTPEQRRQVVEDLGGSFAGVRSKRVKEAADVATGKRLPDRPPEPTVPVPGRGPVPLSRTRVLEDLEIAHAALVRAQRVGANVIHEVVAAVPPGPDRLVIAQRVETCALVIGRFMEAVDFHYGPDDGPAQERMALGR